MGWDLKAVIRQLENPTIEIILVLWGRGYFKALGWEEKELSIKSWYQPISIKALVCFTIVNSISPKTLVRRKEKILDISPEQH